MLQAYLRRRLTQIAENVDPRNLAVIKNISAMLNSGSDRVLYPLGITAKVQKGHWYEVSFDWQVEVITGVRNSNIYIWLRTFFSAGIVWRAWLRPSDLPWLSKNDHVLFIDNCNKSDVNGTDTALVTIDDDGHSFRYTARNAKVYEVFEQTIVTQGAIQSYTDFNRVSRGSAIRMPTIKGNYYHFVGKAVVNCTEYGPSGWDLRIWKYLSFPYIIRYEHRKIIGETIINIDITVESLGTYTPDKTVLNIDVQGLKGTVQIVELHAYGRDW